MSSEGKMEMFHIKRDQKDMTNTCKGWKHYWEKSTILWSTDKIEMWMIDQIKVQSWIYDVGDSAMIM